MLPETDKFLFAVFMEMEALIFSMVFRVPSEMSYCPRLDTDTELRPLADDNG